MSFLDRFRVPDPTWVAPDDFTNRVQPQDVVLDVRTRGEYAQAHLEGAELMDIMDPSFRDRAATLAPERTYYVYCQSGNRSGQAVAYLRSLGIENAYNIGGIGALARAGARLAR